MAEYECPHTSFHTDADVNRINPTGDDFKKADRFLVSLRINCVVCGKVFIFPGFPEIPHNTIRQPNHTAQGQTVLCVEIVPDAPGGDIIV